MPSTSLCNRKCLTSRVTKEMAEIEAIELERHRAQIDGDVKELVEKYQSIFGWDIPDIDLAAANKLILGAIRQAVDGLASAISSRSER